MAESKQHQAGESTRASTPYAELASAARRFLPVAEKDQRMALLLLVDPIQAFADAGIPLTKRARKLLRRQHPDCSYGDHDLYEAIKTGARGLSWIDSIELGRPRDLDGAGGVAPASPTNEES